MGRELLRCLQSGHEDSLNGMPFGNVQALAPLAKVVDPARVSFSGQPTFDPCAAIGDNSKDPLPAMAQQQQQKTPEFAPISYESLTIVIF